ncbi:MAG: SDR family NAD(P)-dependent oxidoreductase, partial [Chloroflexi bacterium]
MSGRFEGRTALVTGGGRGIGRAIAAALARQGMTVTVLGRQRPVLDEAVAAGDAHFADVADVADQSSISAAIARAAGRQPIDILVANAGLRRHPPRQSGAQDVGRRLGPGHRHAPARHLSLRPGGAATDGAAALRQAGLSLVELRARQPRAGQLLGGQGGD